MSKPVLIIVNGLPGTGKTTLARRLAADVQLPLFSRDSLYETLYDALECRSNGLPPLLGSATFTLLYSVVGSVLAAGQSAIVEQFFGRPELRTVELLRLQHRYDFEPFQILCRTEGRILLERSLARVGTEERHASHQDREWIEQNKERILQGQLPPLALGGQLVEIDTTTFHSFDYAALLQQVCAALQKHAHPLSITPVADRTFGAITPRKRPEDRKELRASFEEEVAKRDAERGR